MFARSIYISQFDDNFKVDENCSTYFTSFHIAEEFNDEFKTKAINILKLLKQNNKIVIVDISPRGLTNLGYEDIKTFIKDFDIDYIRLDYGFSDEETIEISNYCNIAINASTFDLPLVKQLKNKVIAIHNFYPREDTGLDREFFNLKNKQLKENNIEVAAFITGDELLRGPLYKGLPTLEDCRNKVPYIQYLSIVDDVDLVIVSDMGLSDYQNILISLTDNDSIIRVPVVLDNEYSYLYDQIFTNRSDSPNWLIRIIESRQYATAGKIIEPDNCINRNKGYITIDNKNYLRYSGEIQIMKKDFDKDDRVNVIGKIKDEYIEVLDYIKPNTKFIFVK